VTIETAMVFALGFLTAALLSLAFMGAVWRRAVRLTTRRVESAIPLSMAEIKADKDQLRADHALAVRRIEIEAEKLREAANGHVVDIARRNERIRDLGSELDARAARIAGLESAKAAGEETLKASEATVAELRAALKEAGEALTSREAAFASLMGEHNAKLAENDGQRVEIVALRTQVDNLKNQAAQLGASLATAEADLVGHRQSFAETSNLLTGERQRIADVQAALKTETELTQVLRGEIADMRKSLAETATLLSGERRRNGDLQAELNSVTGKLTTETKRVEKLQGEAAGLKASTSEAIEKAGREQQARDAAERAGARVEADRDRLRAEIAALKQSGAETSRTLQIAAETAKAEKTVLEGSLAQAREDRTRIQREVAALARAAEGAAARDGKETRVLRERIDQIAVDVARVTAVLEGPGSRIEEILDAYQGTPGSGRKRPADLPLADRIRAVLEASRRNEAAE
jgi:chromosome segregation ATPase